MKDIKFRAWDKISKCMIYNIQKEYDCSIYREDCFGVYLGQECGYGRIGSTDYEIMQYTNLKDKNGKEIYEGDILCDPQGHKFFNKKTEIIWKIYSVVYVNSGFQSKPYGTWGNARSFFDYAPSRAEIIGNIYENPELLPNE